MKNLALALIFTFSAQATMVGHKAIMLACKKQRSELGHTVRLLGPLQSNLPIDPLPIENFLTSAATKEGEVARRIDQIINSPEFHNFRGRIKNATWETYNSEVWQIRPLQVCLAGLDTYGIKYKKVSNLCEPVATPVNLGSNVNLFGVIFQKRGAGDLIFSCELVEKLKIIADVVKKYGITKIMVNSSFRKANLVGDPVGRCRKGGTTTSFHTMGLGIDIDAFVLNDGSTLDVYRDFYKGLSMGRELNKKTCGNEIKKIKNLKALKLRRIACEIYASHKFSTVLTPNYNCGHRDHYHIDIRPGDNRFFIR